MKIAIVSRGFNSEKGGAERFTSSFCRELVRSGHEVVIFSGDTNSKSDEFKVVKVNYNKMFSWLKVISFNYAVKRELKNYNFDIIYGHCQVFPLNFFYAGGGVHQEWMKIYAPFFPLRLIKYLLSPVHIAMRWLEKNIFTGRFSDMIITNSNLVKKHITSNYSISEERISVIYDGVDHNQFNSSVKKYRDEIRQKCGFSDEDFILLHISNNWERKGLDTILKAMSMSGRDIKLIVVGRGKIRKWKKRLNSLKIPAANVFFAGLTNSVEHYYGASDLFILPTMYDPCSQVCREAMACGLVTVTTLNNGASELIEDAISGYHLQNYCDYESLIKIFEDLDDNFQIENIQKNAILKSQEYSWERCAAEHINVFESFLNNKK